LFTGDEDCKRDPPTYDVVSTLIKAYPPAVTLEDKEEMSALEHAIMGCTNRSCELSTVCNPPTEPNEGTTGNDSIYVESAATMYRRVTPNLSPLGDLPPPF
jgi:hypothetical protein